MILEFGGLGVEHLEFSRASGAKRVLDIFWNHPFNGKLCYQLSQGFW